MRPHFSYEAKSAFGALNPSAMSVLVTFPSVNAWHVVFDKKTATPLFETDSADEAQTMADRYAAISDLAFLAQILADTNNTKVYFESSLDSRTSQDGLELITTEMVSSRAAISLQDEGLDQAQEGNPQWQQWITADNHALDRKPRTIIVGVETQQQVAENDGTFSLETKEVFVMANFDWKSKWLEIASCDIAVLNSHFEVNGKPLYKLLHDIDTSPENEIWYESPEERDDWRDVLKRMPLFSQLQNTENMDRVYAYEGGAVLEQIAKTRPWLVEKDAAGMPIPVRITRAADYENFGEEGLKNDQRLISSIFLGDELAHAARAEVIKEQQRQGLGLGQTMEQGQFVKVAELEGDVVVEAMFDKITPNVIGTRDWVNYRLWVEGELVLDVHPGNPDLYNNRCVSLPPGLGNLNDHDFSLSPEQVGHLLGAALSPVDEDSEQQLPARVIHFLNSNRAEELNGDAQELENGDATIEDGKFVRFEDDEAENESPHP